MAQLQELNVEQIMNFIPHRYPFLLVDKITNIVPHESAIGIKMVTMNEWFFQGHFPEKPIMPGVLIIEAMAQTAGALVMYSLQQEKSASTQQSKAVYFMSVEQTKFRQPVVPGNVLQLHVQKERQRGNVWKFKGQAFVENKLVDEAIFTAMIEN